MKAFAFFLGFIVSIGFFVYMFAVAAHLIEESWNEAIEARRKEKENE
jgi:hypothetical protein